MKGALAYIFCDSSAAYTGMDRHVMQFSGEQDELGVKSIRRIEKKKQREQIALTDPFQNWTIVECLKYHCYVFMFFFK